MKIKTSDLSGIALDWAVAKCEDSLFKNIHNTLVIDLIPKYSSDWSQGGPIIEREYIDFSGKSAFIGWSACFHFGNTKLIAAMRCYVASKLGEEVEVPDAILGVNNA